MSHPNPSYEPQKCLKIGCDKEASAPYEACSALHGADIRMARSEIEKNLSANYASKKWGNRSYTIEEALTYAK